MAAGGGSRDPNFALSDSGILEGEGDLEYTENEVYETIEVRGKRLPTVEGEPTFEIRSQERGAVKEQVEFRRSPNPSGTVHL